MKKTLLSFSRHKIRCLFVSVLLSVFAAGVSYGQARQVSGTVSDSAGEALIGVGVVVQGTTTGVITDVNGRYSIAVSQGQTLVFSYMGYTTREISVGSQTEINVVLDESAEQIEAVVTVGYGVMRKSDIAGSVASVDQEQMMRRNPSNLAQGLQGAAAGVLVSRTSGDPEGGAQIRIRGVATVNGSADPLYVVDGIQVGTNANFLNPADIERIEILKDASATAIYGARGANGVILVTTKKGQSGSTRLNVTANFGAQQMQGKLGVADANLFAYSVRQGRGNDNTNLQNRAFSEDYAGQLRTIDWQDVLTQTALQQNYTVSASGGNENTQANFSVGYMNNQGIVIESYFKRLSARANITQKINNFIEMGGSVTYVHTERRGGDNIRNWAVLPPTMDWFDGVNLISHDYNEINPDTGDYYTFMQITGEGDIAKSLDNPYAQRKVADTTPGYGNRVMANAYLDVKLVKGLSFRTIGSYTFDAWDGSNFSKANNRTISGDKWDRFSMDQNQGNGLELESYLTYTWKNDNHNLTVMAGNNVSRSWRHRLDIRADYYPAQTYRNIALSSNQSTLRGGGRYDLESRYVSWYGRAVYSLKDKYSLIATIRHDGSSNFGAGNRWGTFPSAAVAWRLSEEDFIKDLDFFSNLKLRLSWGQTGNAGGATSRSVAQLSSNRIQYHWGQLNGGSNVANTTAVSGMAQLREIDTNLKWETNTQANIGLDIAILRNELDITLDYFVRDSKDLLLDRMMRLSTGHAQVYTNAGHIRNSGFEFAIAYNKRLGTDWTIGATLTGSTLKNKVIDVGDRIPYGTADEGDLWDNHSMTQNGYAVGSFFGYIVDDIFRDQAELDKWNKMAQDASPKDEDGNPTIMNYQVAATAPGDYRFVDVNGDGHITTDDQTIIGHGFPKLNYGLTINVGWKNLDFMMHMYGVAGAKIFSYSKQKLTNLYRTAGGIQNTLTEYINNAYTDTNRNASMPRMTVIDTNGNHGPSTAYIENGNYLKLANIQIGYTFPQRISSAVKMANARIYFSVESVATISKYNKYGDPEVGNTDYGGSARGSVLRQGWDGGRYPFPRTYTLGLNFQF